MTKRVHWMSVFNVAILPCVAIVMFATIADRNMILSERDALAAQDNATRAYQVYANREHQRDTDSINTVKQGSRKYVSDKNKGAY